MMLTYRASVIELLSGSWPADGSAPICWWECSHLLVGVLPVKGSHILIIFTVSGMATDTFIIRLILWQQSDGGIFIPILQVRKLRL